MKKNVQYLELTDAEIEAYRKKGYVVEELDKFPDGGQLYFYESRPESKYKKENGKWLISNDSTKNKFVEIKDPSGSRTKELNANAKPVDNWNRFSNDAWYGYDESSNEFTVKDNWGRSPGAEWYGFDPKQKTWTRGNNAISDEMHKESTLNNNYIDNNLKPEQASSLYVEQKFKPTQFLTIAEQEQQKKVNKLKIHGNDVINYYKNYHASPAYNKMLKKSAGNNFDRYYDNRNKNLKNIKINIEAVQPENKPELGGYASDTDITIVPRGYDYIGVLPHEVSHATDANTITRNNFNELIMGETFERFIPQKDLNYINSHGTRDTDFNKYVGEPTETRARLNDIRYQAKQLGIYDPFTQKVTPDIYNKLLNMLNGSDFNPLIDLQGVYSNEEILYMLNNISKNDSPSNEEIELNQNFARFGGNIYNKFPDGGKVTPGLDASPEGISPSINYNKGNLTVNGNISSVEGQPLSYSYGARYRIPVNNNLTFNAGYNNQSGVNAGLRYTFPDGGSVYKTKLNDADEKAFQKFFNTLPENLKSDDESYDIRGYWDAEGRPSEFDYSQPKQEDGYYHAYSVNPNTGEYLKAPWHDTFKLAVNEDRNFGYRPLAKVNGRIEAFYNPNIIPAKAPHFLENQNGPINQYDEGGNVISSNGWDYKKEGDVYLTKRTGSDKWIKATGEPLRAIKQKIYNDPEYTKEDKVNDYKNTVKLLISQGYSLDDLVEKRIGTKEGLTNLMPEVFNSSNVETTTNQNSTVQQSNSNEKKVVTKPINNEPIELYSKIPAISNNDVGFNIPLQPLRKFENDDTEYYYEGRKDGSTYKKINGLWYIKNKTTNNNYVKVNDPNGKRSAILNKFAKPVVNDQIGSSYSNFSKPLSMVNKSLLPTNEAIQKDIDKARSKRAPILPKEEESNWGIMDGLNNAVAEIAKYKNMVDLAPIVIGTKAGNYTDDKLEKASEVLSGLSTEGIGNTISQIYNGIFEPDSEITKLSKKQQAEINKKLNVVKPVEKKVVKDEVNNEVKSEPDYDASELDEFNEVTQRNNNYIKTFSISGNASNNQQFGFRNRGDQSDVTGFKLAYTYAPFKKYSDNINKTYASLTVNDNTPVIAVTKDGLRGGKMSDYKGTNIEVSPTFAHQGVKKLVISDKNKYFDGINQRGMGLELENGSTKQIPIGTADAKSKRFENWSGGHLIVENPKTGVITILHGKSYQLQKMYDNYLKKNGLTSANIYETDHKSYSLIENPENKIHTSAKNIQFDNYNTARSGSGNFIYLNSMSKGGTVPSSWEDELTEDEINWYKSKGYRIEELD